MSTNHVKRLSIVWSSLIILLTGIHAYWMLIDDNPPIEFSRFEVVDVDGDRVVVALDFCKRTAAPPTVAFRAQQVGTDTVYFGQIGQPTALEPGCYTRKIPMRFPAIHPGEYHLISTYTYQINPVKERTVTVESGNLLIIGDDYESTIGD